VVEPQAAAGAASFEFYEGIRVFIPGALVAALFAGAAATFTGSAPQLPGGALGAITLSLLAGLVLYYVDAPAKSAAFRKDLPNRVLDEWGLKPPQGTRGTLNTFLWCWTRRCPHPFALVPCIRDPFTVSGWRRFIS